MKKLLFLFVVFCFIACGEDGDAGEAPGCPGGFEVKAQLIQNVPNCSVVLEREDGSLIVIANFSDFSEPIQDGADYIILTEQLLNTPTPCMGALLHLLLCIERK